MKNNDFKVNKNKEIKYYLGIMRESIHVHFKNINPNMTYLTFLLSRVNIKLHNT